MIITFRDHIAQKRADWVRAMPERSTLQPSPAPTPRPCRRWPPPSAPWSATSRLACRPGTRPRRSDGTCSSHLQPLLFNPGGQHDEQQYQELLQAFDQDTTHGQITGTTTITTVRNDLTELARTLPAGGAVPDLSACALGVVLGCSGELNGPSHLPLRVCPPPWTPAPWLQNPHLREL